jgi:UrcA family protein
MNMLSRNTVCFVAAGAAASLGAAIVAVPITNAATQTEETTEVSSISVRVGDLDANTVGGAQHIYYRLQRAAEQVCGEEFEDHPQLEPLSRMRKCEQQAIEPAVDRIHTAPLTAIYIHNFPQHSGIVAVEPAGRS